MKKFPIRLRWIILAVLIALVVVGYHLSPPVPGTEADYESSRLPLLLLVLVAIFVVGTIIEDITTRKPPKK